MLRALIVGIDHYSDDPLEGCVVDAERMHAALARNYDGSRNFDSRLLTSTEVEISMPVLRQEIAMLFEQKARIALFYFAGHGAHDALDGLLITQDPENYNTYRMNELFELALAATHIEEIVIILDCCASGRIGEKVVGTSTRVELREGVSVMTATRSTETAAETRGGGLFTSLVIAALGGGAADILGNVTLPAVYSYVDQTMNAWDQRPLLRSHVSHLTSLRQCRPSVTFDDLKLLPELFPNPEVGLRLDRSYEPTEEPKGHANEKVFRSLQRMRDARLVVPVDADDLYYSAMNEKSCELTQSGKFYRHLAKENL